MKSTKIAGLIIGLLIGTAAIANLAKTMPTASVSDTVKTLRQTAVWNESNEQIETFLTDDVMDVLKSCKPMDEKVDFELEGMEMFFHFKIGGWIENKCVFNFSGKIKKLGDSFRKAFPVAIQDSTISKIEPKVQCEFNKDQLEILIAAIVEEDKRTVEKVNQILKDPQAPYPPRSNELTPNEVLLVNMISQQNVCKILNMDDLMTQFDELRKEYKSK